MLDGMVKPHLDPLLGWAARALVRRGIGANTVTLVGFGLAIAATLAISLQGYLFGLLLILASRLCDGLDGAVARATRPTDFGGYLDIVLDFAFYGLVPLAFALADPAANAVAAGVLLLTFYVNGASFLAYATLAEKRRVSAEARGPKSFFFSAGLTEAGETLLAFVAMCLFPAAFAVIAYVFALLVVWTATMRIVAAARAFAG